MAEIKEKQIQYKVKVNVTNHLAVLYAKLTAKIETKNAELIYESFIEERIGFVEDIRKELVNEKINKVTNELILRLDNFKEGLEILEQLGLEIEEY